MAWYPDLSPYAYAHATPTTPPTLNIGWLEAGQPYPTGDVADGVVARIAALVEHAVAILMRGRHGCDLCPGRAPPVTVTASGLRLRAADGWPEGNGEIRAVGADGTRYAAPVLVLHYIRAHRYLPPAPFVEAVLHPPVIAWADALAGEQCFACGGALERRDLFAHHRPPGAAITIMDYHCPRCAADYTRRLDGAH